jgi:hypothetical protein
MARDEVNRVRARPRPRGACDIVCHHALHMDKKKARERTCAMQAPEVTHVTHALDVPAGTTAARQMQ